MYQKILTKKKKSFFFATLTTSLFERWTGPFIVQEVFFVFFLKETKQERLRFIL